MDLQLQDKTAVVTGSTAGIGRAIARALLAEGARVVINGRTEARTREIAEELDAGCPDQRAFPVPGDLSTEAGVRDLVSALDAVGPVDVLVNNTGIFEPVTFFEIPDADRQRMYELNVMSGVRLSTALAPRCAIAGGAGSCSSAVSRRSASRRRWCTTA